MCLSGVRVIGSSKQIRKSVPDPDLEINGGPCHPEKGGPSPTSKKIFLALRASLSSKNKAGALVYGKEHFCYLSYIVSINIPFHGFFNF